MRFGSMILGVALAPVAAAVDLDATLRGEVLDADGLAVPGAIVVIESPELMGPRSAVADDEGRYRFAALPPGVYTVRVEHPAFRTGVREDVRLLVGGTTNVPFQLSTRDGEDVVVRIEATTPALDVAKAGTGVVLDANYLRDIPTDRDYLGTIAVAPGVVGGGNANVHGAFDSSNQFYIDGVNTTDPLTNTFSSNMNYDAIESIQVLTGGMDAEYGRSLGGAINVVTKSGGNEFEGNVFAMYSNPGMTIAPLLEGDGGVRSTASQLVANLGGPIKRDKAWFYTSLQADQLIDSVSIDTNEVPRDLERYPYAPRNWRSLYWFGKVTVQPNPSHRLWVQLQGDPTSIQNTEQSAYVLPSAETVQNQGGWLGSVGHLFTPNERLVVETQLYAQTSFLNYFPIVWRLCENFDDRGACTEDLSDKIWEGEPVGRTQLPIDADGFTSGPAPYASFNRRGRASVTSSATWFVDALGEHEAEIGIQGELLWSSNVYPGLEVGFPDYTHNGNPADLAGYTPVQITRYDNDWDARFTATMFSAYLQDVWRPVPRLTLRPGVRMDLPTLRDDTGAAVFSRPTFAPRFGAAFDLTGDGRTAVHAHYGRFYDSGFLSISDLLRKKSSAYSIFPWDERTGDWSTEPSASVSSTFLKSDDLRNPYSDEISVGLGREIGDDLAVDVTFVHEHATRFWEDDEVNLIWNADGTDVVGFRNGQNVAIYRLRTPDTVFTNYDSLELSLTKSFGDNWVLLGSYVWARSFGTNDSDQATGVLDIPEQNDVLVGPTYYDRRHSLKMSGSYRQPTALDVGAGDLGYLLGFNSVFYSGTPYRPFVYNDYYGDYSNLIALGQDGRFRLPAFAQTDLRLGLTLTTPATNFTVGADIFNVFNDRTTTAVNDAYDPEATGDEQPFGEVLDRQGPRNMQVFFRGEF
jgi:hypothetical protein